MQKQRSPWFWVPSLYFAEGIPYVVVMTISVIMYKRLGISNADIALYTSWLYLPWVIKPLWSPIVDIFKTKRLWIIIMQLLIGASLASIALTIPVDNFFKITLAIFWLLAFSSATHDIAADGFYMLGLSQHQQAWFVGVRSTFYRLAMLTGQGLLVILAGYIESHSGLQSVEVTVQAVQQGTSVQKMIPAEIKPDSTLMAKNQDEMRIICDPQTIKIPYHNVSSHRADSLLQFTKEWNRRQGQPLERQLQQQQAKVTPTWWDRYVVQKLESALETLFKTEEKTEPASEYRGNLGMTLFYLSQPPDSGKKVTINFGREKGDKSIMLIEGMRMVFDHNNWNKPVIAAFQLDPKLDMKSSATFQARAGNIPLSWIVTFTFLAALFLVFFIYHRFMLPKTDKDTPRQVISAKHFIREFGHTFALFFKKDKIGISIAFLLLFRLGESQLVKLASPFLLDSQEAGGLGLTTGQVGFVYGTIGLFMLSVGGILGGLVAARHGLKKWIWWMAIAINLPDVVYIYLSNVQPDNFLLINICVGIEQFGYGFGFTAYMLYMIYVSEGEYKTAHFAITTGFMALGMMLPGMISGWIQEVIGYPNFFLWVLISTIPGFIILKFLPLAPEFGKKESSE
ncbi:MFS transporter [candidate division KSB1 bacterium]|nr:MFS transporter [candidate division KSB1 bacterium]